MRLSDTQYRLFVRVGILTVVVAVFAFDKTPPTLRPIMMALAAVGAALGFFPLFTSHPFESSEENEASASESEARSTDTVIDIKQFIGTNDLDVTEVDPNLPFLESFVQKIDTQQKQYLRVYGIHHTGLSFGSYTISSLANHYERSERVKEVHDLINKLKGTPQTFYVELTSNNSIIVHCEGRSQSSMILAEYEKDLLNFDEPSDNSMTSIQ
jgi:hypothetical protein